jgi:fatty acid synthase subunit alpha
MKIQKIDLKKLTEMMSIEEVKEKLGEIVDECFTQAKETQVKHGGHIKLERGFATIPLPGIDVPFHSRYLWAGVLPFRTYLSKKINPADLNPELLVGKYIPNLTAVPFQISKEYAELVFTQTDSPRLDKVLKAWEKENWDAAENRSKLGYIILVELLAYQFASPVRWIETQDRLFTEFKFARLIELGPGPTLTGMAQRTLKAKYQTNDDSTTIKREIYCIAKNQADIYYIREDEPAAPEAAAAAEPAPSAAPTPAPAAAAAPAPAPVAASAGPAASVPDEPLKAVDTLRVIIAQKLKKSVGDISLSKNIKDMVGGKSTLQNEILGDLQAEFSSAPEKGEELPLDELGAALNVGYSGTLGKHTNGLVSRLVGSKLPGGFGISAVKGHLSKQWGLGPGRTDGALLVGLTMEPAKRLGSEGEAKAWLDSVTQAYAQQAGISLSSGGGGGASGGGGGGAVVDSEALNKLQAQQDEFVSQQVDVLLRYLKRDGREGFRLAEGQKVDAEALQAQLDAINREHGETYINGIQPSFEVLKARHFNSAFNWVRQDALSMFYDIIFGRLTAVDRDVTRRCLIIMNRADRALVGRYVLCGQPQY